eukprot:CAMPEP_0173420146 /NCGR_PEP_ID=MMETSP1357-20121228/1752_1 /TAXON_ID=77926 /ORGANISM="Hemiselmis rufescens, Strain PCC563" /LENGTH=36 /DNA_ID= /DNA_START= /DNA_END= /DNA_ORIENTATION=
MLAADADATRDEVGEHIAADGSSPRGIRVSGLHQEI